MMQRRDPKVGFQFSAVDDSQVENAFAILQKVGAWLESQGRRQRISKTPFESYLQWQSEKANFVVTEASQMIGLVTLRFESLDEWPNFSNLGPVLMLRALATHPEHQGRGVGAFAIRESILTANQASEIFLDCVSDSLPEYYSKFGFKSVGQQLKTYPDGQSFEITLMRWKLA